MTIAEEINITTIQPTTTVLMTTTPATTTTTLPETTSNYFQLEKSFSYILGLLNLIL